MPKAILLLICISWFPMIEAQENIQLLDSVRRYKFNSETDSIAWIRSDYKYDDENRQVLYRSSYVPNDQNDWVLSKYEEKEFDELAAVIFDEDFNIIDAVLIPHEVVGEYAKYRKHVNAHILFIKGPILSDPRVKCIKEKVSS